MIQIKRALISVSDKTGVIELSRFLSENGVEILSTGGTMKALKDAGVPVRTVEDYTGFPEMMDGRLKTLHPKIHGGLLALEDNASHKEAMQAHDIQGIDLLVVNLYPFAATIAREGTEMAEAIENIDIGGPTMLRAAAKNYRFSVSVCDPRQYSQLMEEIREKGGISHETSLTMARHVFNHTASYDAIIASYLNERAGDEFPETLTQTYTKIQALRYGENPHQQAGFYRPVADLAKEAAADIKGLEQLQGKELSYNNMLDFNAALLAVLDLPGEGAVIVKHLNPCGAAMATSGTLKDAFLAARLCDPTSAFGGVIAVSGIVDGAIAELITENFAEGVIAFDFSAEARTIFSAKKNLRLIRVGNPDMFRSAGKFENRTSYNGLLYQQEDSGFTDSKEWKCVTKRKPDEAMMRGLIFAWRLTKHVKSNAIVYCSETASLGIGAGQMSRIDSAEIAALKAQKNGLALEGSLVGSDAFFPFRDGIDALAGSGVSGVVQPGGSMRDDEVIAACDEHGIAMMFTGRRHFRH